MTILVDSDILIEVCRGRDKDIQSLWLQLIQTGSILQYSPVSAAELWSGVLPHEHALLNMFFQSLEAVPIHSEIGRRAGEYLQKYRKSHNIGLGDALIAASAIESGALLWTRNKKHYPMNDVRFYLANI